MKLNIIKDVEGIMYPLHSIQHLSFTENSQKKFIIILGDSYGLNIKNLDKELKECIQSEIAKKPLKELLVGEYLIIPYNGLNYVYAPIMRVDSMLPLDTVNIYLAFKAIFNSLGDKTPGIYLSNLIENNLPLDLIFHQITKAIEDILNNYLPKNIKESSIQHQKLYNIRSQKLLDLKTNRLLK